MKLSLSIALALPVCSLLHAAGAQRLTQSCAANNVCVVPDVAATCNDFMKLSHNGRTCLTSNKLLSTDSGSVLECAAEVVGDAACSAVFMYDSANTRCHCHVSSNPQETCTLGVAASSSAVYTTTVDAPFCSCSPAASGKAFGGKGCDEAQTTHLDFVDELNYLNDKVNAGELLLRAAEILALQGDGGIINDVTLSEAAHLLDRGFDGEVKLNMVLADSAVSAAPVALVAITEAMVALLNDAGHSYSLLNFDALEASRGDVRACTCAPVETATVAGCGTNCTHYELDFLVAETARFEIWELSLIIVAAVLAVCLIAIGLSFVKSDAAKKAEAAQLEPSKHHDAEKGVEMTKTASI